MDYTILILAIAAILMLIFIVKIAKKHFFIKTIKLIFYIGIIMIILIVLGAYFDVGGFLSEESTAVQTGAAVIDVLKQKLT